MATARAEYAEQAAVEFDGELFVKLVALFDSSNMAEAQGAFRKAVVMCGKNGLRFGDAVTQTFGQNNSGDLAELEGLRLERREWVPRFEEANSINQQLRAEIHDLKAALAYNAGGNDYPHMIDLGGRLRRAWRFPQFRLLLVALTYALSAVVPDHPFPRHSPLGHVSLTLGFALIGFCLFCAWSVAQFHRHGLASMLMKWVVYFGTFCFGGLLLFGFGVEGSAAMCAVLAVALLLTLTKLSGWLRGKIRLHFWENPAVVMVRRWFHDR